MKTSCTTPTFIELLYLPDRQGVCLVAIVLISVVLD